MDEPTVLVLESPGAASWDDPGCGARPILTSGSRSRRMTWRARRKAIALPGAQNAFRRMHLNEWTEQAERWIDLAAWDACAAPVNPEELRGRRCFGGLDLSAMIRCSIAP